MQRTELEDAINRLGRLLHDGVSDEAKYQQYFEKNPIVFKALGYIDYYPKPKLPLPNGEFLIPDFLVKRADSLFEIIELKTPQERLIREKKHRDKLSAKLDEYISQVQYYSEYFDDNTNCDAVRENMSLAVQKRPDMMIIVGMDAYVDKKLLHPLIRRRSSGLKIVTYDYILSTLQLLYISLFGENASLSGASLHTIITLHEVNVNRRQFIFDAGDSLTSNRWSIYLDERNNLHFEIIDKNGLSHTVSLKPDRSGFKFDVKFYLCCEFGSSDNYSLMQILVDNRIKARSESMVPLSVSTGLDFSRRTIAADISGRYHGTLTMAGLAIYNITLPFQQRYSLTEAIFDEFFGLPELGTRAMDSQSSRRPPVAPNESAYLILGNQGELK